MHRHDRDLYTDAQRYDLVLGRYAAGSQLEFYQRQIARYGQPVLELACGTGRLSIPLAQAGIALTGLDLAQPMLALAALKAAERGVNLPLVQADMCGFHLDRRFQLICIAAQSLAHLHTRQELEACFACVRRHLAPEGRFLVELFNPSIELLARSPNQRYPVGSGVFTAPDGSGLLHVSEQVRYDAATQVNHITWYYHDPASEEEHALTFAMRQFFPQELNALLSYNGFVIEHKYGAYDETPFSSHAPKQLVLCRAR